MEQNITTLYERVFDDEGNVKACGRRACQELMMALERFVGTSCGDKENGYIFFGQEGGRIIVYNIDNYNFICSLRTDNNSDINGIDQLNHFLEQ